jgi:hypothetical protein
MGAAITWKGRFAKILASIGLEFKSGETIRPYAGDPNTVVTATKGSLILDTVTGKTWRNTDGATDWEDTLETIGTVTGEPTGFQNMDQWVVEYDPTTREVTLTPTGTQSIFAGGKEFVKSAPFANSHDPVAGKYFFQIDTTGAEVVGAAFDFTLPQAAVAIYDPLQSPMGWAIRETHGLVMSAADHLEFHEIQGTYRISGGGFGVGSYTVYDPGDATNPTLASITPSVAGTDVADEDLRSTLAFLADGGPYTWFRYLWTTAKWDWTTGYGTAAPYYHVGNVPYYNPSSGGDSMVALVNDDYFCVYLVAIPVAADAISQNFRYIWVQGQQKYTPTSPNTAQRTVARDRALAEDPYAPGILVLDALPSPEFVIIAKAVMHYSTAFTNNDYRLRMEGYQIINRTRTGGGANPIILPSIFDSNVSITTASAIGGLNPSVESNQKLVNERYAAFGYIAAWATGQAYRIGNVVTANNKTFRCLTAHTSGVFYTDVAAGYWDLVGDGGRYARAVTPNDTPVVLLSADVLGATERAATVLIKVSATRISTGVSKFWLLEYGVKRVGATASVFKISERAHEEAGSELWTATVTASGSNLVLTVVGFATGDTGWNCVLNHSYI